MADGHPHVVVDHGVEDPATEVEVAGVRLLEGGGVLPHEEESEAVVAGGGGEDSHLVSSVSATGNVQDHIAPVELADVAQVVFLPDVGLLVGSFYLGYEALHGGIADADALAAEKGVDVHFFHLLLSAAGGSFLFIIPQTFFYYSPGHFGAWEGVAFAAVVGGLLDKVAYEHGAVCGRLSVDKFGAPLLIGVKIFAHSVLAHVELAGDAAAGGAAQAEEDDTLFSGKVYHFFL